MADARRKVLVVDDESSIRDSLRLLLKTNFEVETAEDGQIALESLERFKPDLILLDVIMPKLDGLEALKQIKVKLPQVPVIMLTASNTVKSAVQAMKDGAHDYLSKPFDVQQLTSLIVETLDSISNQPAEPLGRSRMNLPEADFGPMVGRSRPMSELFAKIEQIAQKDTTVLVRGESGTGKELVARLIHEKSSRKNSPFVAINCAAIPETLIESELFGHEKGAFTHAIEKRIGHFELANKGTLFLDEIGELSLNVQVKMLRFLQEQEFYRVGCGKPTRVDVRVVTATNKNLEDLVREKRFREDLFYRVHVITLDLPPLRDRFEDIIPLAQHFVKKYASQYGGREIKFAADATEVLVQYAWPGNVRELENVIESLIALAPNEEIRASDLPARLKEASEPEIFKSHHKEGSTSFTEAERQFESQIILKALQKANFVQTRAASILGISRRILKYKMDKLGIADKPTESTADSGEENPRQ